MSKGLLAVATDPCVDVAAEGRFVHDVKSAGGRNGKDVTRILVALHHTELGGSQLNALDLATSMRDRDVTCT